MNRRRLTHLGPDGSPRMVDVGSKAVTARFAVAECEVVMDPATLEAVRGRKTKKGDAIEVARLAGIAAAKQTAFLIPLCHPLALTRVDVKAEIREPDRVVFTARVEAVDRTGVEMEALTSASVAALTLYDMAKALDRGMEIRKIRLLEKAGGKSGHYMRRKRDSK